MNSLKVYKFGEFIHWNMIQRIISPQLINVLFRQKAILLFGPRQVGKTTLVRAIVQQSGRPFRWFSGDEPDERQALSNVTSTRLKSLFGPEKLIVIDEAQRIENIGLTIKLAVDNFPDVQVIATGSSAFELANKINEPLTGRKYEFYLYPFSFDELSQTNGLLPEKRLLENRLLFGAYPEEVNEPGRERATLQLLSDSYLYKDLFALEGLKRTSLFSKLLSALALQVGSEVSYTLRVQPGRRSDGIPQPESAFPNLFWTPTPVAKRRSLRRKIMRSS